MLGRTPVAVMVLSVLTVAVSAAPTSAQVTGTADQAQADVDFPVYELTRQIGLLAFYGDETGEGLGLCTDGGVQAVRGELRRGRLLRIGRRWVSMRQASARCAVGPVGNRLRTVRVLGRQVVVRRHCVGRMVSSCKGQPVWRRVHTMDFSLRAGAERTFFAVSAGKLSVRAFVRVMRSLRRVDLSRPVVSLEQFLSPDGEIFCMIFGAPAERSVACNTLDPHRSASLGIDGTVGLCDQDPGGCVPQFDSAAPRLVVGQTVRFGGFACVEHAASMTCTVEDGKHAGKGFRIDAASVVEVAPAPG